MHSHTETTINVQSRAPGGEWQVRNAFIDENKLVRAGSMPKAALLDQANKTMQAWRSYEDGRQLRVFNSDDTRQQEPEPKLRSLGAAAVEPELTSKAKEVLESLCQHAEGPSTGEWRDVYLDNARPAGMGDKSFRSYLAALSKAGFYRPIDSYAWGEVRDTAFQVVP